MVESSMTEEDKLKAEFDEYQDEEKRQNEARDQAGNDGPTTNKGPKKGRPGPPKRKSASTILNEGVDFDDANDNGGDD